MLIKDHLYWLSIEIVIDKSCRDHFFLDTVYYFNLHCIWLQPHRMTRYPIVHCLTVNWTEADVASIVAVLADSVSYFADNLCDCYNTRYNAYNVVKSVDCFKRPASGSHRYCLRQRVDSRRPVQLALDRVSVEVFQFSRSPSPSAV